MEAAKTFFLSSNMGTAPPPVTTTADTATVDTATMVLPNLPLPPFYAYYTVLSV
jgi:hypothetical protein